MPCDNGGGGEQQEVVIVGAGIAVLATALALKRLGVRSLVLERSDELRTTGAAIMLFPNALRALDVLGVAHKLTSLYRPLQGGCTTNLETGQKTLLSYGHDRDLLRNPQPVR